MRGQDEEEGGGANEPTGGGAREPRGLSCACAQEYLKDAATGTGEGMYGPYLGDVAR